MRASLIRKKKKEKAVERGKCYGPGYTATYFSFQEISRFDILRACIPDQKYRHDARQNFYSEWRPSNESKIEQFHLEAALRNDVYWP